jgi:hypothetical protein
MRLPPTLADSTWHGTRAAARDLEWIVDLL